MKIAIAPSSDRRTEPTSTPSSLLNCVILIGLKSGADATYTLRIPRSYETHATLSFLRAVAISSGDGSPNQASMLLAADFFGAGVVDAFGPRCAPTASGSESDATKARRSFDMREVEAEGSPFCGMRRNGARL